MRTKEIIRDGRMVGALERQIENYRVGKPAMPDKHPLLPRPRHPTRETRVFRRALKSVAKYVKTE